MRKKYLSALLFGALLFASAGTFTSCKDYDDDIDGLRTEITDLKSAITELQNAVQKGKYVTAVSGNGNVITFTFSDGSTTPITVETESGEASQTVTIGEDGEVIINGEGTGYYTTKTPTEAEVEVGLVKKGANGTWEVLGEDGEYTDTKIPVSGVTVSGSEAEGYTFTIVNANGESQTVKLPSAASAITELTLGTKVDNTGYTGSLSIDENDFLISHEIFDYTNRTGENNLNDSKAWMGNKDVPADGDYIFASPTKVDLRIDPVEVPAENIKFYLTNTKNEDVTPVVLTAAGDPDGDKPMTETEVNGRAAVAGNGLWVLSMANQVVSKNDNPAKVWTNIQTIEGADYVHAVNANHAFRSEYRLTVHGIDAESLTNLSIKGEEATYTTTIGNLNGDTDGTATYKTGKAYEVKGVQASALYDMYLTADETDVKVYGLTFNQDAHTFTIGKNPDVSSIPAEFDLIIYTIANNGNVDKTVVTIVLNSEISAAAEYGLHEHDVNKDNNVNYFDIDLATMKTALGDNLDQWLQNVNLSLTQIQWSDKEDGTYGNLPAGITANVVSEVLPKNNSNYPATANRNNANFIQVDVNNASVNGLDLDKTYYIKATFKRSTSEILNSIIVPVEFHAPALADLFTIKDGYVEDGVINAYFYKADGATIDGVKYNSTTEGTDVDLDRYFSAYVSDATVAFSTDNVGETGKKGTNLFDLSATVFGSSTAHTTLDFNAANPGIDSNNKPANGYGEAVTVEVNKSFYNNVAGATTGWNYTQDGDDEYSFQIRLMSPIYEGEVRPVTGNTITISGNEWVTGASITGDMIAGYDYNNNKYSAVPDDVTATGSTPNATWYLNPQIESIIPSQDKNKYITNVVVTEAETDPTDPTGKKVIPGEFRVFGTSLSNTQTVDMPVTVTDAWGYELEDSVPVTVQYND